MFNCYFGSTAGISDAPSDAKKQDTSKKQPIQEVVEKSSSSE
jgi:hypothetical protein